jgi:hypothetical protein
LQSNNHLLQERRGLFFDGGWEKIKYNYNGETQQSSFLGHIIIRQTMIERPPDCRIMQISAKFPRVCTLPELNA